MFANPGLQDVAEALGAEISTGQIDALFGRPSFSVPRYTAFVRKILDKVRVETYRKGAAALIDDGDGFPTFAELLVAARLRAKSWDCAWFSAFGALQRIRKWPWDKDKPNPMCVPPAVENHLQKIAELRQSLNQTPKPSFRGITDVVAWRDGELLMIECKREKEDRLRRTQEEWFHAALMYGLPSSHLGVFEWHFASAT